jgi:RNA polymerase sigma-70 factor (ECF subfamily)
MTRVSLNRFRSAAVGFHSFALPENAENPGVAVFVKIASVQGAWAPDRSAVLRHHHQTAAARAAYGRRALKHSNKKLKALLLENLDALRRFCFSLAGNAADGDDLAQGTVELLLRKGVPANVPFLPWMFRVCKNHWIDGLRARSRTQTASADELERHQSAHDGEAEAIHRIQVGELERAVGELDEDQRLVLSLVTVQGFSYREAAEILEIPIGTVMSRLSRARKRLLERSEEKQ